MRRLLLVVTLLAGACAAADVPEPVPTTTTTTTAADAPPTTAAESRSGVLSLEREAWTALGIADYDLEYRFEQAGADGDSGTYRAQVRDGEPVNCYLDGELSMRLECDRVHYSVESIFQRIINGDARDATVTFDPDRHFPALVDHDLRQDLGGAYTLEVLAFSEQEPVDWVAYVTDAVDWLEKSFTGTVEVDWEEARSEALALVVANPRRINAYAGLERLTLIARGSIFRTPREVNLDSTRRDDLESQFDDGHSEHSGDPPSGQRIGSVAYLRLPGPFPNLADGYAQAVHDLMADLDTGPACGWIVDLRDEHFFDVARDLIALGPLLDDGIVLTYALGVDHQVYSYHRGVVYLNDEPVIEVYASAGTDTSGMELDQAYQPAIEGAPIAVLTSIESSIWPLMALDRSEGTRVFGQPAQSGLGFFSLAEPLSLDLPLGGRLYASRTPAVLTDDAETYDPRPDEIVLTLPGSEVDETLGAAVDWLDQQPSCAASG